MIIDCHGHFTTTPPQVAAFREQQTAEFLRTGRTPDLEPPSVTDEEIRKYYGVGTTFNVGEGENDKMAKVAKVEGAN